jgi:hypothetical protein
MSHWTAGLFSSALESVTKSRGEGKGGFSSALRTVIRYPIKVIAAFFVAPFLAFRVARSAKNPVRRAIATVGIILGVVVAYFAGTFLGTAAGALFVLSHYGPLMAAGFFFGTVFSVVFTVAFQILMLNATCWLFLNLSSEDVIQHLKDISD